MIKFKTIGFILILLVLSTDRLFIDLIPGGFSAKIVTYLAVAISMPLSFLFFNRMNKVMKWYFIVFNLYMLFLVLESYQGYRSFFVYPHVFSKILPLYFLFAIYAISKENLDKQFKTIVFAVLIIFLIQVVFLKRHVLSLSAFYEHDRGFPVTSVYLVLIPCLYFFNKLLYSKQSKYLYLFLFTLAFIVFLQHRTVWIATAVSVTVSCILFYNKSKVTFNISKILPSIILLMIGFFIAFELVILKNPDVLEKLEGRVMDIFDPTGDNTAGWRYEQFLSYWPFIQENMVTGLRFEGFELPIQFYVHDSDELRFEDGTGHHFHSFYTDILFYHGIIGFLLMSFPILYYIGTGFSKNNLTLLELVLLAFVCNGFFYGISYWLPGYFYGLLGIGLRFNEMKMRDQ